jgi:hypothetical protein
MSDLFYVTHNHNPPMTSEEMAAHMAVTAENLYQVGMPFIFIKQEPHEPDQIAGE